ncbi:hypothetical protein F5882DRAFT_283392, partial [Hyaloscypha sp. PMI_1271]
VDGEGGTRKTHVILMMSIKVQELALEARKRDLIFRAAPIGITTFNIIRRTLYSLLRLLVKGHKSNLSPRTL